MDSMDLFKTWQSATERTAKDIQSSKEEIMEAIRSTSSSTIGQIKWRMKMKLGWITLFLSLIVLWTALDHSNVEVFYFQAFLFVMFLLGLLFLYPVYRKMNNNVIMGGDALSVMKSNANLIRKALRIETIWGLVFIPVSCIVGYSLGQLYTDNTIADIMADSRGLVILLIVTAILVPLANIGAYKANQKAFGEFIAELDSNIMKMEAL